MDRFRQVNEGLGISAGDTMLLTVARRLQRFLRRKIFFPEFQGTNLL